MKKVIIFLSVIAGLFLVGIIGKEILFSLDKKFTKFSVQFSLETSLFMKDQDESKKIKILKNLKQSVESSSVIYMEKIKYPTDDIGYLFFNDKNSNKNRDLLFKVVKHVMGRYGALEPNYTLKVIIRGEYYDMGSVYFSKVGGSGAILIKSQSLFSPTINYSVSLN